MNVVVDTNLWVSYLLGGRAELTETIDLVLRQHVSLYSTETFSELTEVLTRRKFARYLSDPVIAEFLMLLTEFGREVEVSEVPRVCRDPKDDKFLALAVAARADYIVTGDDDLLALKRHQGVPIVTVRELRQKLIP